MKKYSTLLLISIIVISIFGIIMIYSASYIWADYKYNDSLKYVKNQSLFFLIGLVLLYFFSNIKYTWYYKNSNKILLACFILLILVLIPGIGSIRNGSRSWFGIGPFGIQPSEAAKIGLIIFTSKYLSKNDYIKRNTFKFLLPILLVLFMFFLLILLEPDFGTGMVIVCSIIGLLFISGCNTSIFIPSPSRHRASCRKSYSVPSYRRLESSSVPQSYRCYPTVREVSRAAAYRHRRWS